jgi:mannose-binding lectin 2
MLDWEVQFQFHVHGHGKDLFGDGFAFWYARDRNQLGPVFGSIDNFYGLAIILDTYSNHNGPHNVNANRLDVRALTIF